MKTTIIMYDHFGSFCANSEKAISFNVNVIKPLLDSGSIIFFDFSNVKNMNSSFANALFTNIILNYGTEVLSNLHFSNCHKILKVLISSALEIGLKQLSS
jgi:hypothetical protein